MSLTTITLIGGGACGTAAFIELFIRLKLAGRQHEVAINLIEKDEEVGPGLAFGTPVHGHMLNTASDLMGIHVQEPKHFSSWLESHRNDHPDEIFAKKDADNTYTTRRLYGDYLAQQFSYYRDAAAQEGLQTTVIRGEVTTLEKDGRKWRIRLDEAQTLESDFVLLFPGTPDSTLYSHLDGKPGYFPSPWQSDAIGEKVGENSSVAVLGAGLSAIDAIMTLADNGHKGKITLYSPDGLMPRVQPRDDPGYSCRYLNMAVIHKLERKKLEPLSVKELFRLYKQDVEHLAKRQLDWKSLRREGRPAQQLLADDIRAAENGGDELLQVAYATREYSSEIWLRISEEQRLLFKKWFGPYWTITRHSMPLPNAKRLLDLFENGQLQVRFPVDKIEYDDAKPGFSVHYGEKTDHPDYVINAVGPAASVDDWQSPLMKNLGENGIVSTCKAGGIEIDPETMQVIGRDAKPGTLYAAGHVANGTLIDVNAVWFNIQTIGRLCAHLTRELGYARNS